MHFKNHTQGCEIETITVNEQIKCFRWYGSRGFLLQEILYLLLSLLFCFGLVFVSIQIPIKSYTGEHLRYLCVYVYTYAHVYLFICICTHLHKLYRCVYAYIYTKPSICIHILYACTYIPIFVKSRRKTALPLKGCPDVTFVIPKSQSLDICLQEFVSNGAAGP